MKVEEKGHTIILHDTQGNPEAFLMKVTHEYKTFEKYNIIMDISHCPDVTLKTISQFKPLSKMHRKAKKSFVIVASGIEFSDVPDALHVVPTLLEAQDLIEMDEIERDLGF